MKKEKVKKYKKTVAIIGLGYVGLPLACLCAEKGYRVYGIDKDRSKINKINKNISPIDDKDVKDWIKRVKIEATADYSVIKKTDIVVICVPTPVDKFYNPDLKPVISATENIRKNLKKGHLIIMESTVNPGVCEEVMLSILEKSGLKAGRDFDLAHCPERINPGDPKWNVRNIPRCIGAFSKKGLAKAVRFYQSILEAEVRPMKSLKEAEATKIIENAFRDVNIAFVNELAKSFEKLGIDLIDVLRGSATKPFAFMPHWPSCGVGGHCIPVDPYYLIERAKMSGFDHKFLKLAREINNSMPGYTIDRLKDALNQVQKSVKGTKIGVLGLSYKANVGDIRESPSLKIIKLLDEQEAKTEVYDPFFPEKSTVNNLDELLKKVEALVIATDHSEFVKMDLGKLKKNKIKVVIDGKNCLDKEKIKKLGIIYKGIGR
jgi:nucleotide sugar dehydrogenase